MSVKVFVFSKISLPGLRLCLFAVYPALIKCPFLDDLVYSGLVDRGFSIVIALITLRTKIAYLLARVAFAPFRSQSSVS